MSENNRQLGQTPIFGQLFTYLKKFLLHWNSKSECYNSQIICTKNFIKFFLQGKKLSRLQNPNFVIFRKKMLRLRKSPHMFHNLENHCKYSQSVKPYIGIRGDFLSHNIFLLKMTKLGFCNRDNSLSCNKKNVRSMGGLLPEHPIHFQGKHKAGTSLSVFGAWLFSFLILTPSGILSA